MRAIAEEYGHLNYRLFNLQLRAPTFRLADGEVRLGLWSSEPPSISLARSLLVEHSWSTLVEVLKHEMAHQFVAEVLGVVEPTAHGPLFSRVCVERGIDPSATGLPREQNGADDSVIKKVMHLLSLARSSEQHEAEAAAAAAQRLMLKYNIEHVSDAKPAEYCFCQLGKPTGRVEESQRTLAAVLRRFFFVEALWVNVYRPFQGRRGSVLEICGSRANVEMAEYVFHFLVQAGEQLWSRHKQAHGIRSNRDRRRFIAGVMAGFHAKLDGERKHDAQRGLIWTGDALLTDYFRRRNPKLRTLYYGNSSHTGAHAAGRRAGQDIVLHRGMHQGSEAGPPKLLPSVRR